LNVGFVESTKYTIRRKVVASPKSTPWWVLWVWVYPWFVLAPNVLCRTPTLAKCGGEAQHLEKLGFGVLRDSRMFGARQQGEKHLALGCSWCHWKGLET
jgi:hypothetical protein